MLKSLVPKPKFRSDLSVLLRDIAEKQVPAKLKPIVNVDHPSKTCSLLQVKGRGVLFALVCPTATFGAITGTLSHLYTAYCPIWIQVEQQRYGQTDKSNTTVVMSQYT